MVFEQISQALVDGLLIVTALTVFAVVVLTARRRHITVADMSHSTGDATIDKLIPAMSVEFRSAVGRQMERVREALRQYHDKVRANAAEKGYALDLPDMSAALLNQHADVLTALVSSLEAGPSRNIASQLQALGGLVARPRGATVSANLYRPERSGSRLGITVEVVSSGSRFARHHLLPEAAMPEKAAIPADRVRTLMNPAARCVAIQLAAWVLQRPKWFTFRQAGPQRDGLIRNIAGLLMHASAREFPDFAEAFREFALDEIKAAIALLPGDYQPHYNSAMVNEAGGRARRSKKEGDDRYKYFETAISEYREAGRASNGLAEPGRGRVQRKINVRRVHAELVSGIPRFTKDALQWLAAQPLDIKEDWPVAGLRRWWPFPAVRGTGARLRLGQEAAEDLYNSACMFSVAADVAAGYDYRATRDRWDKHARRLLGAALALDTGDRFLWANAETDESLKRFRRHIKEFEDHLRDSLHENPPDGDRAWSSLARTMDVVAQADGATGWTRPWWSRVR